MAISNIPIHFVLGRARSGTTLLQLILDSHPEILAPPESPFIKHLYKKYGHIKKFDKEHIKSFSKNLFEEPFFRYLWKADEETVKKDLISLQGSSFSELCKAVYFHSPSKKENAKIIVDKNPQYCLFTKELTELFPEAKFLWITRDYRDQVASMMKVDFEKKFVSALAYRWMYFNSEIAGMTKKHPSKFLHIRYEDLVSAPEKHVQEVCGFLGVNFKNEMLDISANTKTKMEQDPLFDIYHRSLKEKINAKKIYVWKNSMKDSDVRMADFVVGRFAEEAGYERKYKSFSLGVFLKSVPGVMYGRLYFTFLNFVFALPYPARIWFNRNFMYKVFAFWRNAKKKIQE